MVVSFASPFNTTTTPATTVQEDFSQPSPKHRRFIVEFDGTPITTTVTSAASVVRKWLGTTLYLRRYNRQRLVIGLGVQWRPGGRDSPAATIQVCVGRRCLVFQLIHSDTVPNLLRRFLADSRHTFVGMWNHSDFDKLLNSKHVLRMHRQPLDLRHHAVSNCTGRSLAGQSREVIVEEFLGVKGVRFDEMIGRSEWDDQVLGSDQVMFATADAYASFLIGIELKAWKL